MVIAMLMVVIIMLMVLIVRQAAVGGMVTRLAAPRARLLRCIHKTMVPANGQASIIRSG